MDGFELTVLTAGLAMLRADVKVRVRALEEKLGLPGGSSLSLEDRTTRVELKIAALSSGGRPP
jgi:hypothetical protein